MEPGKFLKARCRKTGRRYGLEKLGKIKNLYIRLYDPDSRKVLVEYRVEQKHIGDTALIIGEAYRRSRAWYFKAIGKSSKAGDVHRLADECALLNI